MLHNFEACLPGLLVLRQFPPLGHDPEDGELHCKESVANKHVANGAARVTIPIEDLVNVYMVVLEANYQEVHQEVDREKKLHEDQHGPIDWDHVERPFDQH